MRTVATLGLLAFLLDGCTAPYRPSIRWWRGGYSEMELSPDIATASYSGEIEQPNILLILADDVGQEVLGSYGGTSYATPHLDSLAAGGMRFDYAFSMARCHPSRTTIMSGRYPFRDPANWGFFPEDVETFANVLRGAGYATAVAGKWQLGLQVANPFNPWWRGFDKHALHAWHEGPRYHNPWIYLNFWIWKEVQKPDVYGPDVYTDFLIDFMERNQDRPFLAYYPMARTSSLYAP